MKDIREILASVKRSAAEEIAGHILVHDDPVTVLVTLTEMGKSKDRSRIGFDATDLRRIAEAWERAAIAGLGDLDFVHEKGKFEAFREMLMIGMRDRQQDGVLFLERKDWPKPQILRRAIERLGYAEIRTIQ